MTTRLDISGPRRSLTRQGRVTSMLLAIAVSTLLVACQEFGAIGNSLQLEAARASADSGDAESQFRLGEYYDDGVYVDPDPATAAKWFRAAALQGHAQAQYRLGRLYTAGRGVVNDPAWGTRWVGKAAFQGYADAQLALARAHADGVGLPQDETWALRWMAIASGNGVDARVESGTPEEQRLLAAAAGYSDSWVEDFVPHSGSTYLDDPTIRYVQVALNRLDYPAGAVDGSLGPQTLAAIRQYRSDAGLALTGSIEEDLIRRLRMDFGDTLLE